jgi:pimeloyl-ACP methyl ester carboxylesterase
VTELVRDGLHLHYDVVGSGPRAVVLAHGMTGTGAADWSRLVPHLADEFRCGVPDLRGHGRSDFRDGAVTYAALREDLRALLAQEGLDRPHLVGFSMGAEVLLDLELTHPGTAGSLTLIGVSTGMPPDQGGFGEVGDTVPPWPEGLKRLHADRHGPDHWLTLFRLVAGTWAERPELPTEALTGLTCPLLVVQGAQELAFKRRQARALVAAAAQARLVELPGADHPVHVQQPEAVGALVREFLLSVDTGTASGGDPRVLHR